MKCSNLLLAIFSLVFACELLAQENIPYEKNFASYADYISREAGIDCSIPEGFVDLNQYYVIRRVREDKHAGYMYGPIFRSKDKECIVMYPALSKNASNSKFGSNNIFPRSWVISELKAVTGSFDNMGKPLHDSASIDFNEHVTIVAGRKARKKFNADSVYLYDLPLQEPYLEKYTYRTSMVVSKQQRGVMMFKWFFTPEGKEKEKEYIKMLSKHVWYNKDFRHEEE